MRLLSHRPGQPRGRAGIPDAGHCWNVHTAPGHGRFGGNRWECGPSERGHPHSRSGTADEAAQDKGLTRLPDLLANADVVHIQNVMNPTAIKLAKERPCVATIQDHRVFCPGPGHPPSGSRCTEPMNDRTCGTCLPNDERRGRCWRGQNETNRCWASHSSFCRTTWPMKWATGTCGRPLSRPIQRWVPPKTGRDMDFDGGPSGAPQGH